MPPADSRNRQSPTIVHGGECDFHLNGNRAAATAAFSILCAQASRRAPGFFSISSEELLKTAQADCRFKRRGPKRFAQEGRTPRDADNSEGGREAHFFSPRQ